MDAQKTVLEDGDEFQIKVPKEEHILYGYKNKIKKKINNKQRNLIKPINKAN